MRRSSFSWCRPKFLQYALSLALGAGCDEAPPEPPDFAAPSDAKINCVRGTRASTAVVLCDFRDAPVSYTSFIQGELLPKREHALRLQSPVQFGTPVVPSQAWRLKQLEEEGSFMRPYSDATRDAAGWLLFDTQNHLAMLLVGIEGSIGVIASEFPTQTPAGVEALVKDIDVTAGMTEIAAKLDARSPFVLNPTANTI